MLKNTFTYGDYKEQVYKFMGRDSDQVVTEPPSVIRKQNKDAKRAKRYNSIISSRKRLSTKIRDLEHQLKRAENERNP